MVEKNFGGKLHALDFWMKVSGEKSFLPAKSISRNTESWASAKKASMTSEDLQRERLFGKRKGICGCLGRGMNRVKGLEE